MDDGVSARWSKSSGSDPKALFSKRQIADQVPDRLGGANGKSAGKTAELPTLGDHKDKVFPF